MPDRLQVNTPSDNCPQCPEDSACPLISLHERGSMTKSQLDNTPEIYYGQANLSGNQVRCNSNNVARTGGWATISKV